MEKSKGNGLSVGGLEKGRRNRLRARKVKGKDPKRGCEGDIFVA